MASVSRDRSGTKRIQFTDADGERRAVRLGKASAKAAESFRLRVEALLSAHITNTDWEADLAAWVRDLSDTMHDRLARVGLVEPRQHDRRSTFTLGALLDRFVLGAAVKPATLAAYRQTTGSLREHFGGALLLRSLTPAQAGE